MPPQSASRASYFRSLAESVYAKRPWICATDVLVTAATQAEELLELGAARVLAIGASRGTGELPDPERVPQLELGSTGTDMMGAIRASQQALANVPKEARRRIDAFDPTGEALVVATFFSDGRPVAGRRVFGGRPRAWQELEDKTRHDELWELAGIAYTPGRVVAPETEAIARAADALGSGDDVVLAGDSREGFNGGGSYVRWYRTDAQLAEAVTFFAAHCDRVRVMPLLEGLPCSIHGIVFDDGQVAAFKPCEMLVLREPTVPRFAYSGTSNFWDAPDALQDEMRHVARRVGRALRESVGYRGAFTVDGVATRDGFRPTELNPRFGAALNTMVRGWSEVPLYLLHLAIGEGVERDYRPQQLEELVLERVAGVRSGRTAKVLSRRIEETTSVGLRRGAEGWRTARGDEPTDAIYDLGPGSTGGFLRVRFDPERTPHGPPLAPRAVEVMRYLDRELELGLGELEAAPECFPMP